MDEPDDVVDDFEFPWYWNLDALALRRIYITVCGQNITEEHRRALSSQEKRDLLSGGEEKPWVGMYCERITSFAEKRIMEDDFNYFLKEFPPSGFFPFFFSY